jgi:hypothetical protein
VLSFIAALSAAALLVAYWPVTAARSQDTPAIYLTGLYDDLSHATELTITSAGSSAFIYHHARAAVTLATTYPGYGTLAITAAHGELFVRLSAALATRYRIGSPSSPWPWPDRWVDLGALASAQSYTRANAANWQGATVDGTLSATPVTPPHSPAELAELFGATQSHAVLGPRVTIEHTSAHTLVLGHTAFYLTASQALLGISQSGEVLDVTPASPAIEAPHQPAMAPALWKRWFLHQLGLVTVATTPLGLLASLSTTRIPAGATPTTLALSLARWAITRAAQAPTPRAATLTDYRIAATDLAHATSWLDHLAISRVTEPDPGRIEVVISVADMSRIDVCVDNPSVPLATPTTVAC